MPLPTRLARVMTSLPRSRAASLQRDRDRIVHSHRLPPPEYKTQVFVNHEGDLFRTRLTHSIEVAQLTRGIARELGLNEDLAEAIALAPTTSAIPLRPRRAGRAQRLHEGLRRLRAQPAVASNGGPVEDRWPASTGST